MLYELSKLLSELRKCICTLYIFICFCKLLADNYISQHFSTVNIDKNTIITNHNSVTVYHFGNRFSNKKVLLLSGGFCLCYAPYIKKLLNDIMKYNPELYTKYHFIVLEKLNGNSLSSMNDYVNALLPILTRSTQEISILGFSSGFVVGSHILSQLYFINCKKKLISYDSPHSVYDSCKQFSYNYFFRLDMIMYLWVLDVYKKSNYFSKSIESKKWFKGFNDYVAVIMQTDQITKQDLYDKSCVLFDLPEVDYFNIQMDEDPIIEDFLRGDYCRKIDNYI